MSKYYVDKTTLEMILGGQRSLLGSAKLREQDMVFVQQTQSFLTNFLADEAEITSADLSLVEDLAYALRNTSHGSAKKEAEVLLKKVLHKIERKRDIFNKLQNINFVAFVLNNKKMARELSPEELLTAQRTVLQDTSASPKFKTRLTQQLQSFALLQYAEIKSSRLAVMSNQEFIDVFNLRHKNVSAPQKNIVSKSPSQLSSQPAERKRSLFSFVKRAKDKVVKTFSNLKSNMKAFFYRHEAKFAIGSFALVGLLGYKLYKYSDSGSMYQSQYTYNNSYGDFKSQFSKDSAQSADFAKESKKLASQQIQETSVKTTAGNTATSAKKTILTGDYFDTSLEIHLKSKEKVQSLYDTIDALAEDGKIKFADGTNTKKYAHAFTMYQLIRPNSVESKKIQNLLNGGQENPELINHLVLKAKDNGTGVKPDNKSIKTSNFDMASKSLQQQHLKNLKSLSL